MKIQLGFKNRLIIIAVSGVVLAAVVLSSLFNMAEDLTVADAEKRVRVYLTKEMSEKLVQVNAVYPDGYEKQKKLAELAEELKKVNAVEITSIEVRKLIPDILIRPNRPTHIARVEMRTATEKFPPRYFWLPWSNVDSETAEAAWYFSL